MPPEPMQIDVVERWLRYTSNYGMSVVFTATVLLFLLWVSWTVVSLLKKWGPIWFAWSIRSHQKTCDYLDSSTETLDGIHENNSSIAEAVSHLSQAASKLVEKNVESIRGGSDVVVHLQNSMRALERARDARNQRAENRRRREERRRRAEEQRRKNSKSGKPIDEYPEFDTESADGWAGPRGEADPGFDAATPDAGTP